MAGMNTARGFGAATTYQASPTMLGQNGVLRRSTTPQVSTFKLPQVPLTADEKTAAINERARLLTVVVPEAQQAVTAANAAIRANVTGRDRLLRQRAQVEADLKSRQSAMQFGTAANKRALQTEITALSRTLADIDSQIQQAGWDIATANSEIKTQNARITEANRVAQQISGLLDDDAAYKQQQADSKSKMQAKSASEREAMIQQITTEVAADPVAAVQRVLFGDLRGSQWADVYLSIAEDIQPGVTARVQQLAQAGMTEEQYATLVEQGQARVQGLQQQAAAMARKRVDTNMAYGVFRFVVAAIAIGAGSSYLFGRSR